MPLPMIQNVYKTENFWRVSAADIINLTIRSKSFDEVVIDLGTGDGRFTYAKAREVANTLVIGIDPSHTQLKTYSKKANRDKLENVLFVVGAVENLPNELEGVATQVFINFPWGSLLGGIAQADPKVISAISKLVDKKGSLEITFGYSQEAEPSETKRLGLDLLNKEMIETKVIPEFKKNLLQLERFTQMTKDDIFEIDSSWAKKLSFGQSRDIFKLSFKK